MKVDNTPRIFEPLLEMYADLTTVVQRSDRVYPAAFEPHPAAGALVELSDEELRIDPDLRAGGDAHLAAVAARSPTMHDGKVVACVNASAFPLTCIAAGYFDAIATSDSLCAEYLATLSSGPGPSGGLASLPLRKRAHEAAEGNVLHLGRGRVAAVGVSVLATVPTRGGRAVVLGQRSHDVATDPGLWHVAPSGTLEPTPGDIVTDVVRRELAEELGISLGPGGSPLRARLAPLGIGFDLLRLRPEICVRLDLDEDEVPSEGPRRRPRSSCDGISSRCRSRGSRASGPPTLRRRLPPRQRGPLRCSSMPSSNERGGALLCERLLACSVIAAANRGISPTVTLTRRGVLDESAHLATTFLALSALRRGRGRFAYGALAATLLIDVDHVPEAFFGWRGIMGGSPRPLTHSLTTLALLLSAARVLSRPQSEVLDGAGFGLAVHLLRDLTDGSEGAPLLWPISKRAIKLPNLQLPLLIATIALTAVDACPLAIDLAARDAAPASPQI